MSAYLLSFGGLLLPGGRAADLLGRRWMFMVGTALVLIWSLGCGLAPSGAVLMCGCAEHRVGLAGLSSVYRAIQPPGSCC